MNEFDLELLNGRSDEKITIRTFAGGDGLCLSIMLERLEGNEYLRTYIPRVELERHHTSRLAFELRSMREKLDLK